MATSELPVPTYLGLLWPTLVAMRELGNAASIHQIDTKVMDLEAFTAEQRARPHGDGRSTELEYRLAWARTALKGMGALENSSRGFWRLTPLGQRMPADEIGWRHHRYRAELNGCRRPGRAGGGSSAPSTRDRSETRVRPLVDEDLDGYGVRVRRHAGPLPDPVTTLAGMLEEGGYTLVRAIFENTFFVDPAQVRLRTPFDPGFARYSRQYYGTLRRGEVGTWRGDEVRLDDNSRAQAAWQAYTGRRLSRGSGFGLRHIWGHPWDPVAYTAGWNLAYMPHWAGMLTETQHPHEKILIAVRQASWELFFRDRPVCDPPAFVADTGRSLAELLGDQPLLVLAPG